MRWRKRGIIFCPDGSAAWARTGAMVPTPVRMGSAIRVYFTSLDEAGIGRPGFVDLASDDPSRVIAASDEACFDIGRPGTFDENGAVACSVVAANGRLYMYYVGFELRHAYPVSAPDRTRGERGWRRHLRARQADACPGEVSGGAFSVAGPHVVVDGLIRAAIHTCRRGPRC
jgi:hypothetical protein